MSETGNCLTARLNDAAEEGRGSIARMFSHQCLAYECYEWSPVDLAIVTGAALPVQKQHCEEALGYMFTGGSEALAPGCGRCSSMCCRKLIKGNLLSNLE